MIRGHRPGAGLALLACMLTACSGSSAARGPAPFSTGMADDDASLRALGTDYATCSGTALSAAGDADCLAATVRHLDAMRLPVSLQGLGTQAAIAGGAAVDCARHTTTEALDHCTTATTRFFQRLTDLEYSLSLPTARATPAPPYWYLGPSPALAPGLGVPLFTDTLQPPRPDWSANSIWHPQTGGLASELPMDRRSVAPVPSDLATAEGLSVSVEVRFGAGGKDDVAGVACRTQADQRYLFVVRRDGAAAVLRDDSPSSADRWLDGVNATSSSAPEAARLSGVCVSLSAETTRLLLFVGSTLLVDTVDVWPGRQSRRWYAALVDESGRASPSTVVFRDLSVRDTDAQPVS